MAKRWDEALRSLARRTQGPFRVLAYGVVASADEVATLEVDLRDLLRGEGAEAGGETVAEVADPFTSAVHRPLFKDRVLRRITSAGVAPKTDPVRARRDLETIAADLAGFLEHLDAAPPAFRLVPETVAKTPRPARADRDATPLVLVRQFEDLGCDAEGVAGAIEAIVLRGVHLKIAAEALDTRDRDGRAAVGVAIRLGGIKAARARERSLEDLRRRRDGLQVYGPVPFGFSREGQGLVPVPEQLASVARARELARRGISLLETALTLNRERRSWKDGTPWTWRRVRQVVRNTIYDRPLQGELA